MFAFVAFVFFFSTKPRDWLGRTSLKRYILCRVGRGSLTQSILESACIFFLWTCGNRDWWL